MKKISDMTSGMDAKTLAATVGVSVGVLHVWVQREFIPGVKVRTQGKKRVFDLDAATSLLLIAELVRFGISAPLGSQIAADVTSRRAKRVVITALPAGAGEKKYGTAYCDTDAELGDLMAAFRAFAEQRQEPRPLIFAVIDVEAMVEKLHAAEAEWQRQQAQGAAA